MKKVRIESGVCGFVTDVTAVSEDGMDVKLEITSGCPAVQKLAEAFADELDPYELCFNKPGTGALYEFASENFPGHCGCPVVAGIIKAV